MNLSGIYKYLFIEPLRTIYMYGPCFHGMGFWNGSENSRICSQMTDYSEVFWLQHPMECEYMIHARFIAFKNTCEVVIYFFSIVQCFHFVLHEVLYSIWYSIKYRYLCRYLHVFERKRARLT